MKKLISVLLVAVIFVLSFASCSGGETVYVSAVNDYQTETTAETSTEEETYSVYTPTVSVTPVADWGFYNLGDMGQSWIQITGYNLSGSEPYVTYVGDYRARNMSFRKGYCRRLNIELNDMGYYSATDADVISSYEIVDNDTIYCRENGKSLIIENRKTFNYTLKDFVILEAQDEWYVPLSLLDWDRGIFEYDGSDYEDLEETAKYQYKIYVNTKRNS